MNPPDLWQASVHLYAALLSAENPAHLLPERLSSIAMRAVQCTRLLAQAWDVPAGQPQSSQPVQGQPVGMGWQASNAVIPAQMAGAAVPGPAAPGGAGGQAATSGTWEPVPADFVPPPRAAGASPGAIPPPAAPAAPVQAPPSVAQGPWGRPIVATAPPVSPSTGEGGP